MSYTDHVTSVVADLDGVANDGSIGEGDTIGYDVENLTGGSGSDDLTGNGNTNTLSGGPGDDILAGAAGNDTMLGGGGVNTSSYAETTAAVNVDLATGTATGDGTDQLSGITDVTGGSGDDTFVGDSSANTLFGGGGDDTLSGGDGNDTLTGAAGNDALYGEAQDDNLDGGTGGDYLDGGTGRNRCAPSDNPNDVTQLTCDSTALVLRSVEMTSSTEVSTADADVTITGTVHITDDLAGFSNGGCIFRGPNGSHFTANITSWPLVSGTPTDGVWSWKFTVPRYTSPGTWTMDWCDIEDPLGNITMVSTDADWQNAGITRPSFTVV